jgi:F-type H+-transporting ATPase subunit b
MLRGHFTKKYLLSAVLLMLISFFVCHPVRCEEAAPSVNKVSTTLAEAKDEASESAHETDRSADLIDLRNRFINFTLLVVILVVFVKKTKLMDYLSARREEIRTKLDDLKREKEEAEKKYADIDARLRDFESKSMELLEEYRKEGRAERDRIIEEAKERAKQIVDQSEATIKQEMRSVRNRLKQEIVEMAIGQAKELIQKEISEKDHDDLINQFIEKVGRIN